MQKSETIGKLSKALTAVQSQLRPALKDSDNPFFKSKYADLNAVWDSSRELLAKNGLAVIQGNSVGLDNTVIVETILSHESGEWVQSELCLPLAKHDPQGVGSAITYGRRYGLAAIVGIVSDVDDDGNHASGKVQPKQQQAPKASEPTDKITKMRERISELCGEINTAVTETVWTAPLLDTHCKAGWSKAYIDMNEAQLIALGTELKEQLANIKGGK